MSNENVRVICKTIIILALIMAPLLAGVYFQNPEIVKDGYFLLLIGVIAVYLIKNM
jgi:hypothetical protein